MAVAYDTSTESSTGTSGQSGAASFNWSHAGSASARGALVFVFGVVTNALPPVTSVTYGTSTLTAVPYNAKDSDTEPGSVIAYYADNVPTGTQTVTVNRSDTTPWAHVLYAVCYTVTAGKMTEVYLPGVKTYGGSTSNTAASSLGSGTGTLALASIDDGSPGTNSLRFMGRFQGTSNVTAAGSGSLAGPSIDFGLYVIDTFYEQTAGQGARNVGGATITDDLAAIALAVREIPAVAGSFTANATLWKTISTSFTANSIRYANAGTKTFTASAIKAKVLINDTFTRTVAEGIGTSPEGFYRTSNEYPVGTFPADPILLSVNGSEAVRPASDASSAVDFTFRVPGITDGTIQFDYKSPASGYPGSVAFHIIGYGGDATGAQVIGNSSTKLLGRSGIANDGVVLTYVPDTWYRIKAVVVSGTNQRYVKFWKVGDAEPDDWTQSIAAYAISDGPVLLVNTNGSQAVAFDNLIVKTFASSFNVWDFFTAAAVISAVPATTYTFTDKKADAVIFRNSGTKTFALDAVILQPGGTTYLTDHFNRTVPSGLGASDDGQTWTLASGLATSVSVANGQAAATGGEVNYEVGPGIGPFIEAFARVSANGSGTANKWLIIGSRATDTNARGAAVENDGTYGLILRYYDGGVSGRLTDVASPYVPGDIWNLRIRWTAKSVWGRIWKVGDAEPAAWSGPSSLTGANLAANIHIAFNTPADGQTSFLDEIHVYGPNVNWIHADALISKQQTGSFAADAVIFRNSGTKTLSADAILKKAASGSISADAAILRSGEQSFTAEALISKTESGSFAAEALIVRLVLADTFTRVVADGLGTSDSGTTYQSIWWGAGASVDGSAATASVASDGFDVTGYRAPLIGLVQFDFWVPSDPANTGFYSVYINDFRPNFKQELEVWGGNPTFISAGSAQIPDFVLDASTWYRVKAWMEYGGHETGTYYDRCKVWKVGGPEPDWMAEAFGNGSSGEYCDIQVWNQGDVAKIDNLFIWAASPALDAVFRTLTVDAVIAAEVQSFTADALLRVPRAGAFSADAVIFGPQAATLAAAAVITAAQTGTFTADADLWKTMPGSLPANAVLVKTMAGAFTANASKVMTITGAISANAAIKATLVRTTPADAIRLRTFKYGKAGQ